MQRTRSPRLQILAAALALASVGFSAWAASALVKPANVSARTGDGAATLSWDAVAGATGYQYRQRKAEDDAYGSWLPTATSTAATHTVTPLHNGETYSFQVRATHGAENGPASDAVTTTLLTAPASLTATLGDGRVTLSWQAVAGATGYQHRKRKSHDVDYEAWAATAVATSTAHTVTPLRNGTTYSFQVRATRGADRGPASAEVMAAPFAPCGGESVNADLAGDCETLLAAKAALDPGGSLNWARSRALGEWRGVKVSAGRVARLRCPAGGLAGGRLTDSLGQLTGLTHIQLGECGLAGSIPPSLASLRDLEVLIAYGNDLSGDIPNLGRLSKLRNLFLSKNKLTGAVPAWLGSLVNLEYLRLDRNDLDGGLPALGGLVKLKELGLDYLDLDAGPIPAWVSGLVNLERLKFGNSNRTGAVPPLSRLTKLRLAWLGDNALTDISALAPLVSLEVLHAYGNDLSGAIPNLGRLSKLRELFLSGNEFTGAVPAWLGSLVDLEHLSLDGNDLDGGLPALGGLVKLKELGLRNNLLSGSIPATLGNLPELTALRLSGNQLGGCIPTKLASHASTINPQKNGTNLVACVASGATPLASDAVVPAIMATARDERVARQGLPRVVSHAPSPHQRDDDSRARWLWPAPSEAAFGVFRLKVPNPMPDLYLAPSGESAVLALSCFFPVDWLGERPHAAHAATSTAVELATVATVGDLLILTPNQRGLEGELAVVVARLGQRGGASARLRVVVRSHAPPDNARWRVSTPGASCPTASPGRKPRVRFPR